MAEAMSTLDDALTQLRQSIAAKSDPTLAPSDDLARATHLAFNAPTTASFPLDTPTRFISSGEAIDLRSVWFAWKNKDAAITDYISLAQSLNDALAAEGGSKGRVRNLVFIERLDLITWLEGASDTSDFIKPLDSDSAAAQAAGSAQVASGATGGASVFAGAAGAQQGRTADPKLREIYNNERRMGDRNSVLRGIKPTVSASSVILTEI
jgi:parafibromin